MRCHPRDPQTPEQPLRQGTGGKGHCVEALQWLFETRIHRQIGRDLPRVDETVLPRGQPMSEQSMIPEAGGQSVSGKTGQVTQRGHPEPAEGVDQLVGVETFPERGQIEPGEKIDGVCHHPRPADLGCGCGPTGGEWPVGDPEQCLPSPIPAHHPVQFLDQSLGQSILTPVEANRSGNRDEDQTGRHHLHPRDQVLDRLDHRLETS